jgi:hypothetical protein
MQRYRIATASRKVPGTTLLAVPATLAQTTCQSCGWCGAVRPAAGPCAHHGDDPCPTFDWISTVCGQRAVTELQRITGAPLPAEAFVLLADHALSMHDAGTYPGVAQCSQALVGDINDGASILQEILHIEALTCSEDQLPRPVILCQLECGSGSSRDQRCAGSPGGGRPPEVDLVGAPGSAQFTRAKSL